MGDSRVDTAYRSDLRDLNERNFARFDAMIGMWVVLLVAVIGLWIRR
jgi:hypothetical protein